MGLESVRLAAIRREPSHLLLGVIALDTDVNAEFRKPCHLFLPRLLFGKRKLRDRFLLYGCVPRLLKSGTIFCQFLLAFLTFGFRHTLFSLNPFLFLIRL